MSIRAVAELESAEAAWQKAEAEQAFWRAHRQELLEKYPDQFVVVLDGEVITAGKDLQEVLDELERRGIQPTDVWSKFIASDPKRLML